MDFLSKYTGQRIEELLEQGSATPPLKVIDIQGVFGTEASPSTMEQEKYDEIMDGLSSGIVAFKDGIKIFPVLAWNYDGSRATLFHMYGGNMVTTRYMVDTYHIQDDRSCYVVKDFNVMENAGDGTRFMSDGVFGESQYSKLVLDISGIVSDSEDSGVTPDDVQNLLVLDEESYPCIFITERKRDLPIYHSGIIGANTDKLYIDIPYYFTGSASNRPYSRFSLRHLRIDFTYDTWTRDISVERLRLNELNMINSTSSDNIASILGGNITDSPAKQDGIDVFNEIKSCIKSGGHISMSDGSKSRYPIGSSLSETDTLDTVSLSFLSHDTSYLSGITYKISLTKPDHVFSCEVVNNAVEMNA